MPTGPAQLEPAGAASFDLAWLKAAGLKGNAYLVVVSNPVDVLTYLAGPA